MSFKIHFREALYYNIIIFIYIHLYDKILYGKNIHRLTVNIYSCLMFLIYNIIYVSSNANTYIYTCLCIFYEYLNLLCLRYQTLYKIKMYEVCNIIFKGTDMYLYTYMMVMFILNNG